MLVSPEEYLAAEREAEFRSEYVDGQVLARARTNVSHNYIIMNLLAGLRTQFGDDPCEVFVCAMRVRVKPGGAYFYPDVLVVRGELVCEDREQDTLLNPKVIIEVLSPATETYDRGTKFEHYRQLKSMAEFLFIDQDRISVEHYVLQADGHWDFSQTTDLDATVYLPSIGAYLKVSDIYHRVLP